MATLGRRPPRFLDNAMRRKLEVSTALSWEALVDTHVVQAQWFIGVLSEHEPLEESLPRYLREMDLQEAIAIAIRTRVLALVEQAGTPAAVAPDDTALLRFPADEDEDDDRAEGGAWKLLRQPQRVVRDVRRRQRRTEDLERLIMLGLARAEEEVIETHVENAIGFVALFEEQLSLDRAVQQYLGSIGLSGGRAQTVFQRTMARLAEVHLLGAKPGARAG